MESASRDYQDQVRDIYSDKRGRIVPHAFLRRLVLLLDVARNEVEFKTSGDFIFADRNSTGVATIKLNNSSEDPMPFAAFDNVEGVPIDRILVSHAAQAGLVLNLWYGYHGRFRANSNSLSSILSTVNVADVAMLPGTSFSSNAALVAGTPLNILAAVSNAAGLRVHDAGGMANNGTGITSIVVLAKATAPASVVDGDLIAVPTGGAALGAGNAYSYCRMLKPRRVALGLRLDYMVGISDTGGQAKTANYDVL